MLFTYTYRSSDGQRHTAEIEAESRDAAFAKVRSELGVKPIKVVAEPATDATRFARAAGVGLPERSEPEGPQGAERVPPARFGSRLAASAAVRRRLPPANLLTTLAALAAITLTLGTWLYLSRRPAAPAEDRRVSASPREPSTLAAAPAARPRPRSQIDGFAGIDLEKAFDRAAERFLARYAMPGERTDGSAPPEGLAEELIATIKSPIPVGPGEPENVRRLKGVVAGIKADVMLLLASGQGINDVLLWLENRQAMEAAYRDRITSGLRARPSSRADVNQLLRSLGLREAD